MTQNPFGGVFIIAKSKKMGFLVPFKDLLYFLICPELKSADFLDAAFQVNICLCNYSLHQPQLKIISQGQVKFNKRHNNTLSIKNFELTVVIYAGL